MAAPPPGALRLLTTGPPQVEAAPGEVRRDLSPEGALSPEEGGAPHPLSAPLSALKRLSSGVMQSWGGADADADASEPSAGTAPAATPGARSGVGIRIAKAQRGEGFLVTGLAPGGAAETSGQVRVNQLLVAVNGFALDGRSSGEVGEVLQGAPGEPVVITVLDAGGARRDVFLRRTVVQAPRPGAAQSPAPPANQSGGFLGLF